MIDIEYDVLDAVYPVLCEAEEGETPLVPVGNFSGEYVPAPASLPFVTLIEIGNETDVNRRSTSINEDYALIAYDANVYSMTKDECKQIMGALDDKMLSLGFNRTAKEYIPNLDDPLIHRMTARYLARVDQNKVIYRRR